MYNYILVENNQIHVAVEGPLPTSEQHTGRWCTWLLVETEEHGVVGFNGGQTVSDLLPQKEKKQTSIIFQKIGIHEYANLDPPASRPVRSPLTLQCYTQ